jgi:hypothetical protein
MSTAAPDPMKRRLGVIVALALATLTVGASLAACGQEPGDAGPSDGGARSDQAMLTEALEFGRIVLAPSGVVLGIGTEQGMDTLYQLAVQVEPGDVEHMLSQSDFTEELQPGRQVFMPTVEGVDVGDVDYIASAQDSVRSGDGTGRTVFRDILVDRSDPAAPVVHLWLFTT